MVEAPEPVLVHLCHTNGLHKIPVGNNKTNRLIEEIPKHCDATNYLSDTHSVSLYPNNLFFTNDLESGFFSHVS